MTEIACRRHIERNLYFSGYMRKIIAIPDKGVSDIHSEAAKVLLTAIPRGVGLARSAYGALAEPRAVEAVMKRMSAAAAGSGLETMRKHCMFLRSIGAFTNTCLVCSPRVVEPELVPGYMLMKPAADQAVHPSSDHHASRQALTELRTRGARAMPVVAGTHVSGSMIAYDERRAKESAPAASERGNRICTFLRERRTSVHNDAAVALTMFWASHGRTHPETAASGVRSAGCGARLPDVALGV